MADDAHGRPKPTARRRRKPRTAASSEAQATAQDAAPNVEPAPSSVDPAPEPETAAPPDSAVVDIWPMPDSGPGDRAVCPFLRSADDQGALGDPIDVPAAANRCAALAEAVPQSLRQQELVCLTTAHTSCPRVPARRHGRDRSAGRSHHHGVEADARDHRGPGAPRRGVQCLGHVHVRPGRSRPAGRRRDPVAECRRGRAIGSRRASRSRRPRARHRRAAASATSRRRSRRRRRARPPARRPARRPRRRSRRPRRPIATPC